MTTACYHGQGRTITRAWILLWINSNFNFFRSKSQQICWELHRWAIDICQRFGCVPVACHLLCHYRPRELPGRESKGQGIPRELPGKGTKPQAWQRAKIEWECNWMLKLLDLCNVWHRYRHVCVICDTDCDIQGCPQAIAHSDCAFYSNKLRYLLLQNYCRITAIWVYYALSTYENQCLVLSTLGKSLSTLKFRDTPVTCMCNVWHRHWFLLPTLHSLTPKPYIHPLLP